ncbi:MAG: hypothetical protein EA397_09695 [Deltaproteobacteria bacterium]|nr:MAG: hypothetical protein EA397_09695 [Deltaproteobacteria bacterium]
MRRALAVLAASAVLGCTEHDVAPQIRETASEDVAVSSAERLDVPESFRLHWNTTEPCRTEAEQEGIQVYRHSPDAESYPSGRSVSFTASETWYWFHGDNDPADCKDVFKLRGEWVVGPYADLGCSSCNVGYLVERTLVERGCDYRYDPIFNASDADDDTAPLSYQLYLLIDSHDAVDLSPHDGGRISITAHYITSGRPVLDTEYATRGMSWRLVSDLERVGPPASYTWVGESCVPLE